MSAEEIVLDETIHQPTRLRIMTMLVAQAEDGRLAYGFIQQALELTGGNLTTHLRRLEDAGFLETGRGEGRVIWRDGSREPLVLDLAPTRARLQGHGIRVSLRYAY